MEKPKKKLKGKRLSDKKKRRRLWFRRIRFLFIIFATVFIIISIKNGFTPNNRINAVEGTNDMPKVAEVSHPVTQQPMIGSRSLETEKKEISTYLEGRSGHYGVYYCNISTGEDFGINAEEEFTAASTIKIPLNLLLYERMQAGEIDPLATLKYEKVDYEEGTGIIQSEEFGKTYSFRELSKLSITKSDNIATNMLIRYFSIQNLKQYMSQSGAKVVDKEKNTTSPQDMGLFMNRIFEMYNTGSEYGKELVYNLQNTDFNDRIPGLLPETTKVAHKIGTQIGVVNDVGIVFTEKPYILCILSSDVGEKEATKVIADISKKVYDFQNSLQ